MKKDSAKDIKIAFFDVDGTLVDMKKKVITPAMIETLKHLKENGIIMYGNRTRPISCSIFSRN